MKKIIIYTDGSSRGNPGPGGWGTIVATEDHVVELGGGERHTTNNRMELVAAIEALAYVKKFHDAHAVEMRADSSYVINGITKWVNGWKKNGWKNSKKEDVLNRDLWETFDEVLIDVKGGGHEVSWVYTPGHSGIPGNEQADAIATAYADEKHIKLFDGARNEYGIDLNSLAVVATSPKQKKTPEEKARQKMKAHSYLSLVNGKLERHTTWSECEKRVKGVKGARFKKSVSAEDEREIANAWGVR